MWLIPIICLALLPIAAVWLGFLPPPGADTLIHIRNGQCRATRGPLKSHAKEHLTEILSEAGVSRGFIAITAGNRVAFSRAIPTAIHQRLRNVLLNQWA